MQFLLTLCVTFIAIGTRSLLMYVFAAVLWYLIVVKN
jgi:hypothetical protein